MGIIPTRVHAVLDYLVGIALIVLPFLWMEEAPIAAWIPIILGASVILYSLFTAYEYSIVNLIPVPMHLLLDGIGGAFLIASPWLFGFGDEIWLPHVVIGIGEIVAAAATKRRPVALHARGTDSVTGGHAGRGLRPSASPPDQVRGEPRNTATPRTSTTR